MLSFILKLVSLVNGFEIKKSLGRKQMGKILLISKTMKMWLVIVVVYREGN